MNCRWLNGLQVGLGMRVRVTGIQPVQVPADWNRELVVLYAALLKRAHVSHKALPPLLLISLVFESNSADSSFFNFNITMLVIGCIPLVGKESSVLIFEWECGTCGLLGWWNCMSIAQALCGRVERAERWRLWWHADAVSLVSLVCSAYCLLLPCFYVCFAEMSPL